MTSGYDSTIAFCKSLAGFEQIAQICSTDSVLGALKVKHQIPSHDPSCVGHTLGGILIKQAMMLAHERNTDP